MLVRLKGGCVSVRDCYSVQGVSLHRKAKAHQNCVTGWILAFSKCKLVGLKSVV